MRVLDFFVISLIVTRQWGFTGVDALYDCISVLEGRRFHLIPSSDDTNKIPLLKLSHNASLDNSCHIFGGETFRVALDRLTPISAVLIEKTIFIARFTHVVLTSGHHVFHMCKLSGTKSVPIESKTREYLNFSCYNENLPSGLVASSAIEIKSQVYRILPLFNATRNEWLDWLILADATRNMHHHSHQSNGQKKEPSGFIGSGWNSTLKRENVSSGDSFVVSIDKECLPINPYYGMPEDFKNKQWNGAMSKLIRTSPCKVGYGFVGNSSQIIRCVYGTWEGAIPTCQKLRERTPPKVDHASWNYDDPVADNEVIYKCENGYFFTSGTGRASYNAENDTWIDVPVCQVVETQSSQTYLAVGICIGVFGIIAVVIGFIYLFRWRGKKQMQAGFCHFFILSNFTPLQRENDISQNDTP